MGAKASATGSPWTKTAATVEARREGRLTTASPGRMTPDATVPA